MAAPVIAAAVGSSGRSAVITATVDVGSTVTLFRVVDGGRSQVRGAVGYTTVTGVSLFVDYEVPQNVAISYVLEATLSSVTQTSNTSSVPAFDFGGDVIFDLSRPWASIPIYVESMPTMNHRVAREVVPVWDRPDPVVVSGVRQYPAGTLNLITLTLEDRSAMIDTIRSGNVIALSPWQPTYGTEGLAYYSVGDVTETRPSPIATEPARRWSLDVQQVAMPPGAITFPLASVDWSEVMAGGTWSSILGDTWYEVAGI